MVKRIVISGAVATFCIASLVEIAAPPIPRLLYNKSLSAPVGWYAVAPSSRIERDVMVAAYAPADARKLAHDRGYVPHHIPLIKTVWAIEGEEVCSENGIVRTPNRPDILAYELDSLGREMPSWQGCIILENNEVFLVSTDVQTSFDSRYFGVVSVENVLGATHYLGTIRNPLGIAGE
jgi:conjugative transfer signal peptidase TraF